MQTGDAPYDDRAGERGADAPTEESGRFPIEPQLASESLTPGEATRSMASDTDQEPESLPEDALLEVAPREQPTVPPPVPEVARSLHPPAPSNDTGEADAAESESALRPFATPSTRPPERAVVDITDFNLQLDQGPFAGSSLMPPPRTPAPVLKIIGGLVGVLAAASGGYFYAMHVAPKPVAVAAPRMAAPADVRTDPSPPPPSPAAPVVVPEPAPSAVAEPLPDAVPARAKPVQTKIEEPSAQPPVDAPRVQAAAPAETPQVAVPASDPAPVEASPEPAPGLPEKPAREEIMSAFEAVRADVVSCADGGHGTMIANVTIAGTGKVRSVVIEGAFQGTPQGSCMARAVRKATFPPFAQESLKVSYPFGI